ncbi:MAG: PAC2 family protein [Nitrosopumilaceae archaeon]|nr:PAC2 family protein [Nitrosopumilaceae archaeon]
MFPRIIIRELKPINLEGGYLIDGFPSIGFSSVIATESMIRTSQFNLAGVIDSNFFPPISLIKDGKPNFPTRIFVNDELKVAAFLSHLALEESMHREIARKMIKWAKTKKISLIVSSVSIKSTGEEEEIMAVGSTDKTTSKIKNVGIKNFENGTIPGIPGTLLNEGRLTGQDVIVIVFQSDGTSPDFRASAKLCMVMSKLIPGTSCDIPALQMEAEKVEQIIKKDVEESKYLKDSMYR